MGTRKVVLVYHSVSGPECPAVFGATGINLSRFKHQIKSLLDRGWQFGRVSQLRDAINQDTAYVTVDDNLVDFVRNALPWCEATGVPTHHSVIAGTWCTPPIWPLAHRLQILLAMPGRDLSSGRPLTTAEIDYIDRLYAYEPDAGRRHIKGLINTILCPCEARKLLGSPDPDEISYLTARFSAPHEYRSCIRAEFGSHTVTHATFDGHPGVYVATEAAPAIHILFDRGFNPNRFFTLPLRPRFGAQAEQLIPELKASGFRGMFDGSGEWDGKSYIIPRIDANRVELSFGLPKWRDEK